MLFENIKEAFTSIFSNKMRSVLTMLGIIIGISAVITITTIGNSIKSTLNSTLNSLGGNSIFVYLEARMPESEEENESWDYPELEESDQITQEMIDQLLTSYPDYFKGISSYVPFYNGQAKKDKNTYANLEAAGCTPNYIENAKIEIIRGRSLTDSDSDKMKKVCVVSDVMAEQYFKKENPIGEPLSVDFENGESISFTIVGIYKYSEALFEDSFDTSVSKKDRRTIMFLPYQTVINLSGREESGYSNFQLITNPTADLAEADEIANTYFSSLYEKNPNWQVTTFNMSSDLDMINTIINVVTIAISAIAAISLIVGGVGVMNIMLVSITERTKEIGVRMALGANKKTIRLQFVIEAIMLCLIGGLIGIVIGITNGLLLGKVAELAIQSQYSQYADYIILSVHPSLNAILLSLFFSMLTGVFFGFYPANKASKMEVIDALRYE